LLVAALLAAGCVAARDVPSVTVTSGAAPVEPGSRPPPSALESCTRPVARFRDDKHTPKVLTPPQEKQIAESEAYVLDHPAPSDAQGKAELAAYMYARARAFFEANHWAESAIAFHDLAVNHADAEVGVYASMLYLESINVLGSEAERPICYDEMARDVPVFLDLYCKGAMAKHNAEECTSLRKIQRDIDRLRAQKLVESAQRGEGDATVLYQQAGVLYLALARRCVDEAHADGSMPQQEKCDEIAYNAGKAFLAAGQPERASEAAKILLDPSNGMQSSPLAAKLAKILSAVP
jgi:hypothetical protein